jgi:hypothetical protein
MDINVIIQDKIEINDITLQKMIFIYNALENGWTIKKCDKKYKFLKNHEGKKEVILDSYLLHFLETNYNVNNIIK